MSSLDALGLLGKGIGDLAETGDGGTGGDGADERCMPQSHRANLLVQTLTVCYGSSFVASVFPMFPQRFGGAVLCDSC